ncbi:hypothetical protein [Allofournierella sp. CML151]|nr:hypothetical protein [Fournierella sp. CML151]
MGTILLLVLLGAMLGSALVCYAGACVSSREERREERQRRR